MELVISTDNTAVKKEIIPEGMEEDVSSTTMIKNELFSEKTILLEESAIVKEEPNLDNSQTEYIAVEPIFVSCENMKEEEVIQDDTEHVLPQIHAVMKDELIFEEEIMEQLVLSSDITAVKKEIMPEGKEEDANRTRMIKNKLFVENSILLEESVAVEKEPNLDNSQTEDVVVEPIFVSCENIKEEEVIEDEAEHMLPEIYAVMEDELIFEEKIMEQHTPSSTSDLVNKDIIFQGDVCNVSSASNVHNSGLFEVTSASNQKYKCLVCNKTYRQVCSLSRHKLIHSGVKKHKCDICNKSFTHKSQLSTHKLIHVGVKKHNCDVCNKSFISKSNLCSHKLVHFDEKNYQCNVCNRTFARNSTLSGHKLIHSGIKKFHCNVCNKGFIKRGNLSAHKATHTGIKNYHCDICSKAFSFASSLRKHKLTHNSSK